MKYFHAQPTAVKITLIICITVIFVAMSLSDESGCRLTINDTPTTTTPTTTTR